VHLTTRRCRQRSSQEIAKRGTGMRAATFPPANDVITFSDEVSGSPEVEVREGLAEIGLTP
jgi:hypothetical protein